jgi:AAA+ ATPase superfamily predicted ATPase
MNERLPGFVGREAELERLGDWLRETARSGRGKAIAVRGRRAVGKSTLIEELLVRENPPHAFFAAAKDQPSAQALAGFLSELQRSTLPVAQELAAGVRPDSWEAALRLIATSTAGARGSETALPACLVIDELPWLSEQEPSIEGLLQNAWDRYLGRLPMLLVLIGSDLHMMQELERYDRPLHGRVTPFVIEPLNPAEMHSMIRTDPASALDAYCMLGGFPQLAVTWRAKDTVRRYLTRELRDPTSPLVVTGERVMAAELPAHSAPRAVLTAIGAGETEFTKVLHRAGVGRTSLSAALQTLAQKRIVSRQLPFAHKHEAKLSRYTITDPYLRFWLRFIAANLPLIERRRGDIVLERIMKAWSTYRGRAIEPIVRASIERLLPDERFGQANFVSAYWTRTNDPEVDLVGHDDDRRPQSATFVGSIKWRDTAPFSREDGAALASVRTRVPLTSNATLLVGVSRNGFSPNTALDVELGPQELLSAWTAKPPA